jgi:hypothetical protein
VLGTARVGEKKGREQSKASSLALRGGSRGGSGGGGAERPFSLYGFGFLAFRPWQLSSRGMADQGSKEFFFLNWGSKELAQHPFGIRSGPPEDCRRGRGKLMLSDRWGIHDLFEWV